MTEQEHYDPPDVAIEALARRLLPVIRSYFESEEGKKEFAEWQAQQETSGSPGRNEKPDKQVGPAA